MRHGKFPCSWSICLSLSLCRSVVPFADVTIVLCRCVPLLLLLLLLSILCCCRCGHCKEISPIYEKVAEAFAIDDDKVIIGKVDGSKDTGLTTKYSVESFPTFIFFPANSSEPDKGGFYNGPPELEPIVDYVNFKVDLQRQADGKLKFDIGLVPPLDALLGANGYPPRCMGFPLNATFVETFTATLEGLEGTELEHGTKYYLPAVKKVNYATLHEKYVMKRHEMI